MKKSQHQEEQQKQLEDIRRSQHAQYLRNLHRRAEILKRELRQIEDEIQNMSLNNDEQNVASSNHRITKKRSRK